MPRRFPKNGEDAVASPPAHHPSAQHPHVLQAVPDPRSPEFEQFLADLDDELGPACATTLMGPPQPASELDELNSLGLPRATLVDPDVLSDLSPADDADVHETAVVSIGIAHMRRCLDALAPLERRVISLRWGLGCRACSRARAAEQTGLSVRAVARIEQRVAAMLRAYFRSAARRAA